MTLIVLAYLGGVLTILSPCILPVLPFVFARAGQSFSRSALPMLIGMAITFALVGTTLVSAVDAKPKSTTSLRRLDNIAGNPFVSVLVDEYDDDWTQLWWARGDGWARVLPAHDAVGFDELVAKYAAYRDAPPAGPAIVIAIDHWSGWSAA